MRMGKDRPEQTTYRWGLLRDLSLVEGCFSPESVGNQDVSARVS